MVFSKQNSILCYCQEMMSAFVSALDTAVQDEFEVAAQVSDEEWEAIRPNKLQRRKMLLNHMQVLWGSTLLTISQSKVSIQRIM
jgi:hypothetical protein